MIYAAGTAAFAASLVVLGLYAVDHWAAVRAVLRGGASYEWVAVAALVYAVSHLSTALSWHAIVRRLGVPIPLKTSLTIGIVAQIGKYLPGNVAHYFGRAALATRHGVSLGGSGLATLLELAAAVMGGALVVAAMLLADRETLGLLAEQVTRENLSRGVIIACLLGIATMGALFLSRKLLPEFRGQNIGIGIVVAPVLCLSVSFALAGLSFYALLLAIAGQGLPLGIGAAIAFYTFAWLAGFMIPGAPAGLGVRELIIVALLSGALGPGLAVAASVSHRFVTALVDAAMACVGSLLLVRRKQG